MRRVAHADATARERHARAPRRAAMAPQGKLKPKPSARATRRGEGRDARGVARDGIEIRGEARRDEDDDDDGEGRDDGERRARVLAGAGRAGAEARGAETRDRGVGEDAK